MFITENSSPPSDAYEDIYIYSAKLYGYMVEYWLHWHWSTHSLHFGMKSIPTYWINNVLRILTGWKGTQFICMLSNFCIKIHTTHLFWHIDWCHDKPTERKKGFQQQDPILVFTYWDPRKKVRLCAQPFEYAHDISSFNQIGSNRVATSEKIRPKETRWQWDIDSETHNRCWIIQ